VHADAQVVSFSTTSTIPVHGLTSVLPRWLPDDIWAIGAADVEPTFDARRSAQRRWYRYAVWQGDVAPTGWRGRALAYPEPLDLGAMRQAAGALLGRHDFAALVTQPPAARSTIRTVFTADWLTRGRLALFEVCADAFLKHMVRGIVGSLLWVGRRHWTPDRFFSALATTDRRALGPNAPPLGLTLSRIDY
jgi:tRNA pseudouridine38-40 synthase